jgi:hypothetical protein
MSVDSSAAQGVTVPEALEALRRVYGYHFRREGNRYLFWVGHADTHFPVNLTMNRRGKSDTV